MQGISFKSPPPLGQGSGQITHLLFNVFPFHAAKGGKPVFYKEIGGSPDTYFVESSLSKNIDKNKYEQSNPPEWVAQAQPLLDALNRAAQPVRDNTFVGAEKVLLKISDYFTPAQIAEHSEVILPAGAPSVGGSVSGGSSSNASMGMGALVLVGLAVAYFATRPKEKKSGLSGVVVH